MRREILLVTGVLIALVAKTVGTGNQQDETQLPIAMLDKLFSELKNMTEKLWSDIDDPRWHASMAFATNGNIVPPDQQLLRSFTRFGDLLEMSGLDKELKRLRQKLFSGAMGDMYIWARSDAQIGMVDALYEAFRRFQVRTSASTVAETSGRAFTDLAETILQDEPDSVPTALSKLQELMLYEEGGVFANIPRARMQDSGGDMCSIYQSPQQLAFNIYNMVFLTDIKGYAMMQFSWMLLSLYKIDNFTMEAKAMRERMEAQISKKREIIRQLLPSYSNELWMCDPLSHEENSTYIQVTNLLQGHIENEIDLNPNANCRDNCAYHSGGTFARVSGCYQDLFCNKQRKCNGRIFDCRFIDSDSNVCLANDNTTNRKYDWVEYKNGHVLGRKTSCSNKEIKVDSWWRWVYHCSYCFCLCDEQGPKSDRYFSLQQILARGVDTEFQDSNRVVTGIRFVKINRVIHLQIQDAVALPGGMINSSTVEWRPVNAFKPSDPGIIRGEDFHMMTWEQRAIDLDDLTAPEGNVLTGVRLRKIGAHLNLEILTTPFNFTSGLLAPIRTSVWVGNDNTPASLNAPRTEVVLTSPDVPTYSPIRSTIDSNKDQFIRFTHSDIDKDIAQTTIPFIDAQSVVSDPPGLLIGAGLYHKGRVNFGGFVAPKVFTYDYSQHLTT